jgi:hypothetical protein
MFSLKSATAMLLGTFAFAADTLPSNPALVAHEWGTFTSVAANDGRPLQWAPLEGTPDLPCFVNRLGRQNVKMAMATVRMETPVLYFYTRQPMTLSVHVDMPHGWITEWYPNGRVSQDVSYLGGQAQWDSVEVKPGENPALAKGEGASRYYAARNTDAAALHIGGQAEKMIFYRGIANFGVPLAPAFAADGTLQLRNTGAEPIALAIYFDNRSGKIGYRVARGVKDAVRLAPPELNGSMDAIRSQLTDTLVEFGLYPKEAQAMLETWHDSWFEEGTRVIYIMPRTQVDAIVPLHITPTPTTTARVFVGRVELLSPWVRETIVKDPAAAAAKYGRFMQPFLEELKLPVGAVNAKILAAYQNGGCIR